jgi:glycosyltransferase involved in cell wall biosynthesis
MARICMVVYAYYPTDTRVRREAEALIDRGDYVEIISLGQKDKKKTEMLHGVRVTQLFAGRYRGSNPLLYLASYLFFFIAASLLLAFRHLRKPYQIIQVHTLPDFMVFVAVVPKLTGAKVILDVHDLMPELYQSKFRLSATHWLVRFIIWMERRSVGFADRAIAVHKPHLFTLVQHGNPSEKFIILLNLPDPKIFSTRTSPVPQRKDSGFKLIYHGTVAQRHGLQVVIRALTDLREEINGLKLQIIGEGDYIPHLRNLVRELRLEDCVDLKAEFLPLEDLVPVILQADIGVVPILYDDFTKYMLPVKLLEYVALGIPVICSRTETIESYFDDSMIQYVSPGNVSEFTKQIRNLYQNSQQREQIRSNADRFNREYSWERQKQLYYELIDGLIAEKPIHHSKLQKEKES